jgi:predicted TIM-barrel fold metal-dependent hydrolase
MMVSRKTENGGKEMMRLVAKIATNAAFAGAGILALFAAHALFAGQPQSGAGKSSAGMEPVPALTPYVEAHTHVDEKDLDGTARSALAALGRQNTKEIIVLTLPETFGHPENYDAEVLLPLAKKYPGKFAVLGGGGTLNPMIMQSAATGDASQAVQKKFRERAEQLIREGVAGFGEMSAEHFDGTTPYEYAPADHPLYLLLADIAAQHDIPIDIHMEAVPKAMPLPADLKSPPNPPQLHANIAAFERLLAHNPRAKIIWAHMGSDNTGFRTPDLCRRLLLAHPNLYMEIKADPLAKGKNYPLADGKIKPEWLKLFEDFSDRFIIGSDQHYPEPAGPAQRWQEMILLFNQLPGDVRRKIGTENVAHIYGKLSASSLKGASN